MSTILKTRIFMWIYVSVVFWCICAIHIVLWCLPLVLKIHRTQGKWLLDPFQIESDERIGENTIYNQILNHFLIFSQSSSFLRLQLWLVFYWSCSTDNGIISRTPSKIYIPSHYYISSLSVLTPYKWRGISVTQFSTIGKPLFKFQLIYKHPALYGRMKKHILFQLYFFQNFYQNTDSGRFLN